MIHTEPWCLEVLKYLLCYFTEVRQGVSVETPKKGLRCSSKGLRCRGLKVTAHVS